MKKLLKSFLVMATTLGVVAGATGAYFTSTVTAANNQIVAGTLRLAIDSSQVHTGGGNMWGFPYAYTVVQDIDGVSTLGTPLETWTNAAPAPYAPFIHLAGTQTFQEGNHSYWVAFRNAGTIPMKVKADVNGGAWTMSQAVKATTACSNVDLNQPGAVSVRDVYFYANDNCEGQQECENIYYGLKTGPWTNAPIAALNVANAGNAPITGQVYASSTGLNAGVPVQIGGQQFIIARVDVNFDTNNNCYQGATFTYNLNGYAHQMGDNSAW